jgi:4-carboxymuconolactone decarboxylase
MNSTNVLLCALAIAIAPMAHAAGPAASAPLGNTTSAAPMLEVSPAASRPPVRAPVDHFSGTVWINPLTPTRAPGRASASYVTFEPGARTAWHTHPFGQTLVIVSGTGRVQRWGGPIQEVHAGDVIHIPPGVKHWHGAGLSTTVTHIAIQEEMDGRNVDWLEKVDDDVHAK